MDMKKVTFEVGEMVRTLKGIGWIEVINTFNTSMQYLVRLSHDKGTYWFSESQVFKYI